MEDYIFKKHNLEVLKKLRINAGSILFLIHPGYTSYEDWLENYFSNRQRKNIKLEYSLFLNIVKEKITSTRVKGSMIIAYLPTDKLKESIEIIGGIENTLVVPTISSDTEIDSERFGMDTPTFYQFLVDIGVDRARIYGEVNGNCFSGIKKDLESAVKIMFQEQIAFPSKPVKNKGIAILATNIKKMEENAQQVENWIKNKVQELSKSYNIKIDTCQYSILKLLADDGWQGSYNMLYQLMPEWGKSTIRNNVKKLEKNGIITITNIKEHFLFRENENIAKSFFAGSRRAIISNINIEETEV